MDNGKAPTNVAYTWKKTIDTLAKEFYNGDWHKVTMLNIYVFNDRVNFLKDKNKEMALEMEKAKRKRK